jgi:uncharacterized DUF497 family protein
MRFEWDEKKNKANINKHGIAFEDAAKIFRMPRVSVSSDRDNEERWLTTGMINNQIITVIYTVRNINIRIISARKANKYEQKAYRSI